MASTFKSIENTALLVMAAGKVPLIIGTAGQGKSAMAKNMSKKLGAHYVNIDCNLLKEGEIGGLPIPEKRTRVDKETGEEIEYTVTEYAIHCKLREIQEYLDKNPKDGRILLFFDELNRCEKPVMSELMNLILNREINGFHLDNRIFMMAAMNPSGTNKGYERSTDYAVTDMDAASKNRVIWLNMKLDPASWLDWATDKSDVTREVEKFDLHLYDPAEYKTNIESEVVEFIAMNTDLLSTNAEGEDAFATPRSYQFVSDLLRTYNNNRQYFDDADLTTAIYGCIGTATGTAFLQFNSNNKNPLIRPEQMWGKDTDKEIKKEWLDKFVKESTIRKKLTMKATITFVATRYETAKEKAKTNKKLKIDKNDVTKLCQLIPLMAVDVQVVMMRIIKNDYPDMHMLLIDEPQYVQVFMKASEAAGR